MISSQFDPKKLYRYVRYGRMSTDQQNPRSPEQQFETIQGELTRQRYQWTKVRDFRDNGISGRYARKRPGYQSMLSAIYTGVLVIDLILVDTLERFGRMDDLSAIRKALLNRYGILVLSADTNFADPTSTQGRVFGVVESLRATEAARVKAHDVRRGKRDAALQGHWPGGPPPFGFRLESVMTEKKGRQEVDYSVLMPDPESSWIMQLLFQKARETSWGQPWLAKFLNSHPDIPAKFKPFEPPTIGYWLDNPIYYGTLRWDAKSTNVVDNARVIQHNAAENILYVPDFCEGFVSEEAWKEVQAVREIRRQHFKAAREAKAGADGKSIAPIAPGMTLRYLLTGLVRCGHCRRAMDPSTSPIYTTKAGEEKRYTTYVCPGYIGGNCVNSRRVPEPWLRGVVVTKVRERLFPLPASDDALSADWFQPLFDEVRLALDSQAVNRVDLRPSLLAEFDELQKKIEGWRMSLGNRELGASLRGMIEAEAEAALGRQSEIEATIAEMDGLKTYHDDVLDPDKVLQRLGRLDQVLATNNPTMGNLLLSLHIDRIDCHHDGHVILRTCKLGALAGAVDLLRQDEVGNDMSPTSNVAPGVKPRRRARMRVDEPITGDGELRAAAEFAADPDRFAGLDERWFHEDVFEIPAKKPCWAEEHALEVAQARGSGKEKKTEAALAALFGKSIPTIRSALRYAVQADSSLAHVREKSPRKRWEVDNAAEVAKLEADGKTTMEIAKHFGKSDTTIRKAQDIIRKGLLDQAAGQSEAEAGPADDQGMAGGE